MSQIARSVTWKHQKVLILLLWFCCADQFQPFCIYPVLCAFHLAGINLSNDKILQTRAFSYSDAHRYRLGINYLSLPINAAKNKLHVSFLIQWMTFLMLYESFFLPFFVYYQMARALLLLIHRSVVLYILSAAVSHSECLVIRIKLNPLISITYAERALLS